MYHGPLNRLDSHLRGNGKGRPAFASPAEHAVAAVSVDYDSPESEAASREGLARLAKAAATAAAAGARRSPASSLGPAAAAAAAPKKASTRRRLWGRRGSDARRRTGPPRRPLAELRLLYQRARRDVSRAKAATAIKAAQQVNVNLTTTDWAEHKDWLKGIKYLINLGGKKLGNR